MRRKENEDVRRLKSMGIWIILMGVFIGQLFFYTWCRVQCVRIGYEISKETDRRDQLMIRQNNLRIEISRLKSPERISGIAKNRLGLSTPEPRQIVLINGID